MYLQLLTSITSKPLFNSKTKDTYVHDYNFHARMYNTFIFDKLFN